MSLLKVEYMMPKRKFYFNNYRVAIQKQTACFA